MLKEILLISLALNGNIEPQEIKYKNLDLSISYTNIDLRLKTIENLTSKCSMSIHFTNTLNASCEARYRQDLGLGRLEAIANKNLLNKDFYVSLRYKLEF